jgi:hypothetical protein
MKCLCRNVSGWNVRLQIFSGFFRESEKKHDLKRRVQVKSGSALTGSGQVQVQPDKATSGQVRFEHFQAFCTFYLQLNNHFRLTTFTGQAS